MHICSLENGGYPSITSFWGSGEATSDVAKPETPESLINMKKGGYIYIMANIRQTLYVGVTENLVGRVYQHKNNLVEGFTKKYKLHMLVYYEVFDTIEQSIIREKQIKDMNRKDKLAMIYRLNPEFKDLSDQITA